MKDETKEWLSKAEEDFKTAEFLFKGKKLPAASFYSQQAAEKALKALQIAKYRKFDKVHDLSILGKKVDADENILKVCEKLTPFYVRTRYPDSIESYDRNVVKEAVNNSKEVLVWVKSQLASLEMSEDSNTK